MPHDIRYAYSKTCTWHGPYSALATTSREIPCCPFCASTDIVEVATSGDFWEGARRSELDLPGYEAMLRWSQGKCYPDFETMQNAYRQAMEGQL